MADEEHVKIVRQGTKIWNKWRSKNSQIIPDLSLADLRGLVLDEIDLRRADLTRTKLDHATLHSARLMEADLSTAELTEADLSEADLTRVLLKRAYLRGANLSGATLHDANLNGADLRRTDLTWAKFSRAQINEANLSGANLRHAYLEGANLSGSELRGADLVEAFLVEANLTDANLVGVNLRAAICEHADFSRANLAEGRLIKANLNGATLNGACLWETQRGGWTIKGVACTDVYWDKEAKDVANFSPGDFERLYSEKLKIQIKYPGGISTRELLTLPALIQHLEVARQGCKLRFETIRESSQGAIVTIAIDESEGTSLGEMEQMRSEVQAEAEQKAQYLRGVLENERQAKALLKGEVQALERLVNNLFSTQKPAYYLEAGDINISEYKTNIHGNFQGAMGDYSQAKSLTYSDIGNQIEKSMNLSLLADELLKLRQAMNYEAEETSHYIAMGEVAKAEEAAKAKDPSRVVERLRASGKWALDVATKIGVSLATEAIKRSLDMK